MKQLIYLLFLFLVIFPLSCKKENISPDETKPEDTISVNDTLQIVDNPYFPMDMNDLWIYKDTYSRGFTLEGEVITEVYIDTLKFHDEICLGNYQVRTRNHLAYDRLNRYFNTQKDRITLVLDGTYYVDSIQAITILFTDVKDTSWTVPVTDGNVVYNINFIQKHPDNAIEGLLELIVGNGEEVGLLSEYKFLSGKGIMSYWGTGGSSRLDGYLMDYIDN